MTLTNSNSFSSSHRRAILKEKIEQATFDNDVRLLSSLRARWVHRYGLGTLLLETKNKNSFSIPEHLDKNLQEDENFEEELKPNNIFFLDEQPLNQVHEGLFESDFHLLNEKSIGNDEVKESIDCKVPEKISSQEDPAEVTLDKVLVSFDKSFPPPPRPQLRHLRRWMPITEEDFPKAS